MMDSPSGKFQGGNGAERRWVPRGRADVEKISNPRRALYPLPVRLHPEKDKHAFPALDETGNGRVNLRCLSGISSRIGAYRTNQP